jgi:hypothetical protein
MTVMYIDIMLLISDSYNCQLFAISKVTILPLLAISSGLSFCLLRHNRGSTLNDVISRFKLKMARCENKSEPFL